MDVLLQALIGLAGGAAVSALMPEMQPPSMSRSVRRRVREMLAGLVGAVAASYAYLAFQPAPASSLTTTLAGVAGALWLAGIVEVWSSRRRAGEGVGIRATEEASLPRPSGTPAYDVARAALVAGLIEDALAHEAGEYMNIGRQLPAVRDSVSRQEPLWNSRLQLALRFWTGWAGARDAAWQLSGPQTSIAVSDWPRLARTIAFDLARDQDTIDPVVVSRFAYSMGPRT